MKLASTGLPLARKREAIAASDTTKETTMNTQNTAAIGQHADTMTKEQMEARISLLSDEIDANEEENRAMNDEIESLYKRIDALK